MDASTSKSRLKNVTNPSSQRKDIFQIEDNGKKKVKKRKKFHRANEKMKNIINNIEKEIESQLDIKNEKNDFITTDIEAILREVIMDEDVKEMVRQTLYPQGSTKSIYEPKLTRAKIRELLKLRPDLSFPVLWPLPEKKNSNFVSECLSLINANYSENSSEDEEYRPEIEEKSEDDGFLFSNVASNEILENTDGFNFSNENCFVDKKKSSSEELEENIGQRTRSKLPLTDTPLEVIEQAFIPPDITIDMYESECDNEDWLNFIKGFVQPLDNRSSEHVDDDLEDDPEYNILADEETVDREELRMDRAVEVPRKEVNDLIAELFRDCERLSSTAEISEFTNITELPDDVVSISSISKTNNLLPTEPEDKTENLDNRITLETLPYSDLPVLLPAQRQLLDQQLRQHVQIMTTHFLQFHKHSVFYKCAEQMKNLLTSLKTLSGNDPKSAFYALNLNSSLDLVERWEKFRASIPQPSFNVFRRINQNKQETFSKDFMKIVSTSDAFLYPLLLPQKPFSHFIERSKFRTVLIDSEEWLLAVGLEEFCEFVKKTTDLKKENDIIRKAVKLIIHYLLPGFTNSFLCNFIKKQRLGIGKNAIKEYYETGKAPALKHFIIPIVSKPLFKQPLDILPTIWSDYVGNNFIFVKMKK